MNKNLILPKKCVFKSLPRFCKNSPSQTTGRQISGENLLMQIEPKRAFYFCSCTADSLCHAMTAKEIAWATSTDAAREKTALSLQWEGVDVPDIWMYRYTVLWGRSKLTDQPGEGFLLNQVFALAWILHKGEWLPSSMDGVLFRNPLTLLGAQVGDNDFCNCSSQTVPPQNLSASDWPDIPPAFLLKGQCSVHAIWCKVF